MKNCRMFAASGSCSVPTVYIYGKVENNVTFIGDEFTGTMNSQTFWNRLSEYAKSIGRYVVLCY